jgi:hypothetical protein
MTGACPLLQTPPGSPTVEPWVPSRVNVYSCLYSTVKNGQSDIVSNDVERSFEADGAYFEELAPAKRRDEQMVIYFLTMFSRAP